MLTIVPFYWCVLVVHSARIIQDSLLAFFIHFLSFFTFSKCIAFGLNYLLEVTQQVTSLCIWKEMLRSDSEYTLRITWHYQKSLFSRVFYTFARSFIFFFPVFILSLRSKKYVKRILVLPGLNLRFRHTYLPITWNENMNHCGDSARKHLDVLQHLLLLPLPSSSSLVLLFSVRYRSVSSITISDFVFFALPFIKKNERTNDVPLLRVPSTCVCVIAAFVCKKGRKKKSDDVKR